VHIPEADLPAVGDAAHAVVQEAKDAGVFLFAGGLSGQEQVSVVDPEGLVTDGPFPESKEYLGGLMIVDASSRDEAMKWAAKIAVACRCAQQVREFLDDPLL
jgi:hypothetical protein